MANQKTTMSEESKNDVVKTVSGDEQIAEIEARLAELTGLCGDHSCVFGPPKGLGTNGGCRCEVKRNPKVQQAIQLQRKLSALLRERVETQAESIETFQSQFRVMKEAIERTITFMRRWFGEHSSRRLPGDEELMALLESAITPKETEQKP